MIQKKKIEVMKKKSVMKKQTFKINFRNISLSLPYEYE